MGLLAIVSGYAAVGFGLTGFGALLDKSRHDKVVGVALLGGAVVCAKLAAHLA